MSRRREVQKRVILPDPKYGDLKLAKFINTVMKSGKKSIAEGIVYGALDSIVKKNGSDAMEVFSRALDNVRPTVEVKRRWSDLSGSG